ncbi:acyl-CoA--6-aminopenicillanic acid acyltransferase [Enterococcus sp. 669A]|uniref:Acyl-CoA--6-aminopenicillanic acid acyltransferase n=1 Tax=Candidatus Enterococcus moelleringii TaxID=2815325 RepID=A0ABS3L4Q1_9ENTE|nr:C45 family peptidase [Enterococcus sp. 669A]MBO1304599.1 acyl-CoA--6-aminopenicillanic acid acyltransferase [Enterococcus sp. 669A]
MQHLHFRGDHYSIGYTWGSTLKKNNIRLLDLIPFASSQERNQFAAKCLPIYQQYFPEILTEIKGIADGQGIFERPLQAVLFGMYCLMPGAHCSSFIVRNKKGSILGRNSDFLTATEDLCLNTYYQLEADDHYNFLGNTTAFVEMEDGINEHGLALALTSVAPCRVQPGLNVGMLLRLILERCKTIGEAVQLIQEIPIAGSGTLVVGDAKKQGILVELSPDKTIVKYLSQSTDYLIATNMFHTPEMLELNRLPEDTWHAEERYDTIQICLSKHAPEMNVELAQNLLSQVSNYNRNLGRDTVWSCVYDLGSSDVYRAAGNPARNKFQKEPDYF